MTPDAVKRLEAIASLEDLGVGFSLASHDLEKTPVVEGILRGIKGQYLILDTGVINLRKYTAYQVAVLTE